MGVRDFRTDFPWFSGLLRYLPARWVTSKWFIADFPGCRLSAWVRRYQLERFSTSFVWGYPKPFHFFGWFIILCMAAWTTSWFLAGFFWVSENGAGADVGRGVYFNTYFNHGILKQVADFQINLFQTYFKPISDLFQTYFRPISNLFQTYFKPILNLFSTYFILILILILIHIIHIIHIIHWTPNIFSGPFFFVWQDVGRPTFQAQRLEKEFKKGRGAQLSWMWKLNLS